MPILFEHVEAVYAFVTTTHVRFLTEFPHATRRLAPHILDSCSHNSCLDVMKSQIAAASVEGVAAKLNAKSLGCPPETQLTQFGCHTQWAPDLLISAWTEDSQVMYSRLDFLGISEHEAACARCFKSIR